MLPEAERRKQDSAWAAYRDGYGAQRAGSPCYANPHASDSELHRAWNRGWANAYTAYLEEDRKKVEHLWGRV